MAVADSYKGLRDQLFSLANGKVKDLAATEAGLYALVMETTYPEATCTMVAVSDGSASLYFSNGGGMIGVGANEVIRKQVFLLLAMAPKYLKYLEKTLNTPLTKSEHTTFYYVTNTGIYSADAIEEDLGNNKHNLSPLFHQSHNLITAIRQVDESRAK